MRILAAIALACIASTALSRSQEYNGEPRPAPAAQSTDEIILKWRTPGDATSGKMRKLSSSSGLRLQRKHRITSDTEVLKLERALGGTELQAAIATLSADPRVAYVAPNERKWAHAVPTDPMLGEQWYLLGVEPSGTHTDRAWDVTRGASTTVVAVLDTGVRFEHPDLGRVGQGGKLLDGYDFIFDAAVANDGDGRDDDPADPGDWVTAADAQQPPFNNSRCIPAGVTHVNSSWHGTRVSSLIAALTDNAVGMAGSGWNTQILPVRVLGKCGGYDDDIIAAMRWAAGLTVAGVPNNPRPANIINLSLGSAGACSAAYRAAINEITSLGVLVVVSVGNEGGMVGSPANCPGALGVSGLRHAGTKVGFSNLGANTDIGAPGGNCVNLNRSAPCLYYMLTATNNGLMAPGADIYTTSLDGANPEGVPSVGTSFSAPLVSGAAALMHSVNGRLSPLQYTSLLQESAAPFPTSSTSTTLVCHVPTGTSDRQVDECICTTQTCGTGMLDTGAAVLAAQRPFAIAEAPGTITAGQSVTIDARTSFAANDRTITAYQWSALNVTGVAPTFMDAAQATTTLQVSGTSQFTLRLTVTDDQGTQDTADLAVATPATPPPVPPTSVPQSGGGGGGGNIGALLLGFGALPLIRRYRRRRLHHQHLPAASRCFLALPLA